MTSNQFDLSFTTDKIIQHKREQDFGLCSVLKILNDVIKYYTFITYILQLLVHALQCSFFVINFYHIRFFLTTIT
jgi:hypothetical protein